jgi:hypothetical protein
MPSSVEPWRGARRARNVTLRDVGMRSGGRFKPTAAAACERSERNISPERFCELSAVYGMAPERLLLQIMWRVAGRPEPRIDDGAWQSSPRRNGRPSTPGRHARAS